MEPIRKEPLADAVSDRVLALIREGKYRAGDRLPTEREFAGQLGVGRTSVRLYWIEEPTRADDFAGHARIAREARTPICIGENWWGPHDVQKSLEAEARDYGMTDAMKIGGVTGWLRTAALAEPVGLPLTSHIFPEISTHLLADSPTAHRLEYLDTAGPILKEPVKIEEGHALVPDGPGIGLDWDKEAVSRFFVR